MRGATRGLPGEVTHPSTTLAQSTFSCGVTMGSGALVFGMIATHYGIATVTAGSLEFQDFIPGPWLRQL
ncbi:hypothetical protein OIU85_003421 [Salix viminalis]|uniref:Uncharacterized protein n=1 Tax=Salix viminalis TaxID=40686 RepID=A0A9Q0PZM9_SALVM|nr:hypothetical protein OIU85_003421 [Salix viminalis]